MLLLYILLINYLYITLYITDGAAVEAVIFDTLRCDVRGGGGGGGPS